MAIYSNKQIENRIRSIIDLLVQELRSAGGDGDCFWFVNKYPFSLVEEVVKEYNSSLESPMEVNDIELGKIVLTEGQGCITITQNDECYRDSVSRMLAYEAFLEI